MQVRITRILRGVFSRSAETGTGADFPGRDRSFRDSHGPGGVHLRPRYTGPIAAPACPDCVEAVKRGAVAPLCVREMARALIGVPETDALEKRMLEWAQNEEMVDQHFTQHGRDCCEVCSAIRNLRRALDEKNQ